MLTDAERRSYLDRIGLAHEVEPTREGLDALIYAHQTHVPFETIGVHRSAGNVDLSLDALYRKVVEERKGGYCFELNKLFQALLESIGYDARAVLCRAVRGRETRMPINHRGIVVALDEGSFSADVGFGGPMPAGSLALADGLEQDICGETYITEQVDGSWWKIDRITKAQADLHDDELPARRQTELELCSAAVEDIDFAALSLSCAQPGTLFRDHEVVNLRTDKGYKGYKDGILTIRDDGEKSVVELATDEERACALAEHFALAY